MPCSECTSRTCYTGEGQRPADCPELSAAKSQAGGGTEDFALAAQTDRPSRLSEIIAYARYANVKRIGIACCVGLHDELRVVGNLLQKEEFEVFSVMCKSGGLLKSAVGVPRGYRITTHTGYGVGIVACNPVAQALVLEKEGTDLNLIVGLCAGHDSIFMKHSAAPVVTFIAKDRTNGHNPASVLCNYYGDTFFGRSVKPEGAFRYNMKHASLIDFLRLLKWKLKPRKDGR